MEFGVNSDEFTFKVWDEHSYSKPAKVSITVTPAPPETRLAFALIAPQTDGQMRIVLNTQRGGNYEISVSTNLVNWTSLLNAQATESTISLIDTNTPGFNARFYRAKQF